jgi:uncharacterized protein (TIGR03067 family)
MVLFSAFCFISATSLADDTGRPDDAMNLDEAKKVHGVWKRLSEVQAGVQLDKAHLDKLRVTIGPKKWVFRWDDTRDVSFSYRLDFTVEPHRIDLLALDDGMFKGDMLQGIFKIEGDKLTICMNFDGLGERPLAFRSPRGSNLTLYVLKLVKP